MPQDKRELRFLAKDLSSKADSRTIQGYASMYEKKSKNLEGGFREIIKRGAFANIESISPDLIANIDHKDDKVLARYGTNLKLQDNPVGLHFEFDVPETTYGNDLLVNIRSGNINKCSFAFTVDKDSWSVEADGTPLRTIYSFKELHDIAIVTTPAYNDTSVAIRSMQKCLINNETKARAERLARYE